MTNVGFSQLKPLWFLAADSEYCVMKMFLTNQNRSERIARLVIALFLIPLPFTQCSAMYSKVVGVLGLILLFNALVGTCYIYRLFGINTCKV